MRSLEVGSVVAVVVVIIFDSVGLGSGFCGGGDVSDFCFI